MRRRRFIRLSPATQTHQNTANWRYQRYPEGSYSCYPSAIPGEYLASRCIFGTAFKDFVVARLLTLMVIAICGALLAPAAAFAQSGQENRCFPWQELRDGACVAKPSQAPGQSRQLTTTPRADPPAEVPVAPPSPPRAPAACSRPLAAASPCCRGTRRGSPRRHPLRRRHGERQHMQLPRRLHAASGDIGQRRHLRAQQRRELPWWCPDGGGHLPL